MNFPKFPLVVGLYLIPVLFENIVCMVSTSPFKFTEACLRTYHMVCPGEFYVCAGGECASWCYWVKQVSVRSSWRMVFILYLCWYSALFFYPFLFLGFFFPLRESESPCVHMCVWVHGAEGDGERENPKQVPCPAWSWSPAQDSVSRPWGLNLSQNQVGCPTDWATQVHCLPSVCCWEWVLESPAVILELFVPSVLSIFA